MAKKIGNLITEDTITLEFCKEAIIEAAKHKLHRKSVRKILKSWEVQISYIEKNVVQYH